MDFIKVTQVHRGETKKTWINKEKIIYIQSYEGDSNELAKSIMVVQDIGSPLFLVETCDEIFRKIELGLKEQI